MALIACVCPHCGGTVNLDENLTSGYCTYCGKQIINDKAVVGNVKVSMDRTQEVVNTLKLAKYSMYDGDANGARVLLDKAMMMNSAVSDVWYMDAVIDRRNKTKDLERAGRYPSLGIFTKEDVEVYRNYDGASKGGMVFMFAMMASIMVLFTTIPVSIVFEAYTFIYIAVVAVVCIAVFCIIMARRMKPHIPAPVFEDEDRKSMATARDYVFEERDKRN